MQHNAEKPSGFVGRNRQIQKTSSSPENLNEREGIIVKCCLMSDLHPQPPLQASVQLSLYLKMGTSVPPVAAAVVGFWESVPSPNFGQKPEDESNLARLL